MSLIAIGQLTSTSSLPHNLTQCRTLIARAASLNCKALFLPEASDYIASSPTESLSLCQPTNKSEFVTGLRAEAKKHNLAIHVGIHEPSWTDPKTKIRNTVIWIDENGHIVHTYQKVHLFDVDLGESGGPVLKESAVVEAGEKVGEVWDVEGVGRVGSAICFDMRFPEMSLALRRRGAEIITYPSAFTVPTGKAHWEVLLRARAIETQSYVVAAAQVGRHNEKRVSYGHSMIVDPWGKIVAEIKGREGEDNPEPEIATAVIDRELLAKVRREMPLNRRIDVYPEI
ncbi:Carbon-nitrogen hydrolase [Podospora bellae-mahoneyi]|uniref:Carbon-nitrogen hydrolase n=1 Tax=Podospora bellae-mahoneyi TaxID=2093777 RepID=A0ABR0FFY9_9PEZI|nr:Carbon-nitrogen hydrolase [Podospora bellae-mahoneyi]